MIDTQTLTHTRTHYTHTYTHITSLSGKNLWLQIFIGATWFTATKVKPTAAADSTQVSWKFSRELCLFNTRKRLFSIFAKFKLSQSSADLLVKKCNEEIWQDRVSARDYNKELKPKKYIWQFSKEHLPKVKLPVIW